MDILRHNKNNTSVPNKNNTTNNKNNTTVDKNNNIANKNNTTVNKNNRHITNRFINPNFVQIYAFLQQDDCPETKITKKNG